MADDRTSNLNLPKPHGDTKLKDDVERIRTAFDGFDSAIASKASAANVASSLAVKADLVGGKVPAAQLPSYVDDVIEVANFAALPATGETGKIYITLDDNKQFRWSGSAYVAVGGSLPLASETVAGVVKVGPGLAISGAGELSVVGGSGASQMDLVEIIPPSNGLSSVSVPGGYVVGTIKVSLNGSDLAPSDFTATNGLTVGFVGQTVDTTDTIVVTRLSAVTAVAQVNVTTNTLQSLHAAGTTDITIPANCRSMEILSAAAAGGGGGSGSDSSDNFHPGSAGVGGTNYSYGTSAAGTDGTFFNDNPSGHGGGGGGAGQRIANHVLTLTPGATLRIIVGAGGLGSTVYNYAGPGGDGGNGGNTVFQQINGGVTTTLLTLTGGTGGTKGNIFGTPSPGGGSAHAADYSMLAADVAAALHTAHAAGGNGGAGGDGGWRRSNPALYGNGFNGDCGHAVFVLRS